MDRRWLPLLQTEVRFRQVQAVASETDSRLTTFLGPLPAEVSSAQSLQETPSHSGDKREAPLALSHPSSPMLNTCALSQGGAAPSSP